MCGLALRCAHGPGRDARPLNPTSPTGHQAPEPESFQPPTPSCAGIPNPHPQPANGLGQVCPQPQRESPLVGTPVSLVRLRHPRPGFLALDSRSWPRPGPANLQPECSWRRRTGLGKLPVLALDPLRVSCRPLPTGSMSLQSSSNFQGGERGRCPESSRPAKEGRGPWLEERHRAGCGGGQPRIYGNGKTGELP